MGLAILVLLAHGYGQCAPARAAGIHELTPTVFLQVYAAAVLSAMAAFWILCVGLGFLEQAKDESRTRSRRLDGSYREG